MSKGNEKLPFLIELLLSEVDFSSITKSTGGFL